MNVGHHIGCDTPGKKELRGLEIDNALQASQASNTKHQHVIGKKGEGDLPLVRSLTNKSWVNPAIRNRRCDQEVTYWLMIERTWFLVGKEKVQYMHKQQDPTTSRACLVEENHGRGHITKNHPSDVIQSPTVQAKWGVFRVNVSSPHTGWLNGCFSK